MRLLGKTAIVLGMAGAMALGSMTASEARWRAQSPRLAAGFVAGAAIGAAAANANAGYYYGAAMATTATPTQPAYSPATTSYAYEPAYAAPVYAPPAIWSGISSIGYRLQHQLHRSVARAPA